MGGSFGGSGLTLGTLRHALAAGQPVIVWVPKLSLYRWALVRRTWRAWDGRLITWNQNKHAQVLVGYDASGFWLDNPDYTYRSQGQWLWHYTTAQFTAGWAVLGNQAVVVARGHRAAIHRGR